MGSWAYGGARIRRALQGGRSPLAIAFVALALLIAPTSFAPRASATVMVEVPLERMVREADAIVLGVVERVGVRYVFETGGDQAPHTITTVRVSEWVKGRGDTMLRIDELGGDGTLGGMRIAGTPEYVPGQEVIVFLRRTPEGALRTYAMVQGQFLVQRHRGPSGEDLVVRDTTSVSFASWATGPMTVDHGGVRAMRLDAFLGYLRDTVEQLGTIDGETDTTGGAR